VAGGLLDLAVRMEQDEETYPELFERAESVAARYRALWDVLHAESDFAAGDRYAVESRIRGLQDLGFAVDEVNVLAGRDDRLLLKVAVAARRYHATQLHDMTGLDVGEGQARILLADLRAHECRLQQTGSLAALRWATEVLRPGSARAHQALGGVGDPIQAYCDLLEVRWLLSEKAQHDVGEKAALDALAQRATPAGSAARMAVADAPTGQFQAITPELINEMSNSD
jgi:hypothetical protein